MSVRSALLDSILLTLCHIGYTDIYDDVLEAIERSDDVRVKKFIEEGFDVNTQVEDGQTALMYAAWRRRLEIVEALIGAGGSHRSSTERPSVACCRRP